MIVPRETLKTAKPSSRATCPILNVDEHGQALCFLYFKCIMLWVNTDLYSVFPSPTVIRARQESQMLCLFSFHLLSLGSDPAALSKSTVLELLFFFFFFLESA